MQLGDVKIACRMQLAVVPHACGNDPAVLPVSCGVAVVSASSANAMLRRLAPSPLQHLMPSSALTWEAVKGISLKCLPRCQPFAFAKQAASDKSV